MARDSRSAARQVLGSSQATPRPIPEGTAHPFFFDPSAENAIAALADPVFSITHVLLL